MTNPATTVEDLMDLIYQSQDAVRSLMPFDGGYSGRLKHCSELHSEIKSALTTLIAERDQAVKNANHYLEVLGQTAIERDAALAEVERLREAVQITAYRSGTKDGRDARSCAICSAWSYANDIDVIEHEPDCIIHRLENEGGGE